MNLAGQCFQVPAGAVMLDADLVVPERASGVVLFAHGSGSSRHSPRNRYVAAELQRAGLATALADLLTQAEEQLDARTGHLRFDIGLLASRLTALTDWLAGQPPAAGLPVGLFGASTGAAAALVARGGRPDLAGDYLRSVRQPTLLIVGELDTVVIELNRTAVQQLSGEARLEIIPGASPRFEEPGTLDTADQLARGWFVGHTKPGFLQQPAGGTPADG